MIPTEILNKPLLAMTGEEILKLFSAISTQPVREEPTEGKYVTGLNGLAKHLNCSYTTVTKMRNSGLLDEATMQVGKRLLFHKEKLEEILSQNYENK